MTKPTFIELYYVSVVILSTFSLLTNPRQLYDVDTIIIHVSMMSNRGTELKKLVRNHRTNWWSNQIQSKPGRQAPESAFEPLCRCACRSSLET